MAINVFGSVEGSVLVLSQIAHLHATWMRWRFVWVLPNTYRKWALNNGIPIFSVSKFEPICRQMVKTSLLMSFMYTL